MTPTLQEKIRAARDQGVGNGMVIAAAIIADHDPVWAQEILHAAGITTIAEMRHFGVDAYDANKLRAVIRNIARRDRMAA